MRPPPRPRVHQPFTRKYTHYSAFIALIGFQSKHVFQNIGQMKKGHYLLLISFTEGEAKTQKTHLHIFFYPVSHLLNKCQWWQRIYILYTCIYMYLHARIQLINTIHVKSCFLHILCLIIWLMCVFAIFAYFCYNARKITILHRGVGPNDYNIT